MSESDEVTEDDKREMTEAEFAEALEFFGGSGEEDEPECLAVVSWSKGGFAGPGWYVYSEEYPDEGSSFAFKSDALPAFAVAEMKRRGLEVGLEEIGGRATRGSGT